MNNDENKIHTRDCGTNDELKNPESKDDDYPGEDDWFVEAIDDIPYYKYNLVHSGLIPVDVPTSIDDVVRIDWKKGDETMKKSNPMDFRYRDSFRPPGIPDVRFFKITELHHEHRFQGFTLHDPNQNTTEIYWDSRGGWTEMIVEKNCNYPMHYSHPILTFFSPVKHIVLSTVVTNRFYRPNTITESNQLVQKYLLQQDDKNVKNNYLLLDLIKIIQEYNQDLFTTIHIGDEIISCSQEKATIKIILHHNNKTIVQLEDNASNYISWMDVDSLYFSVYFFDYPIVSILNQS